jgi:hypothetical protein
MQLISVSLECNDVLMALSVLDYALSSSDANYRIIKAIDEL